MKTQKHQKKINISVIAFAMIYSILTAPFPVQPQTTLKVAIDIYARDAASARKHLTAHLRSAQVDEENIPALPIQRAVLTK